MTVWAITMKMISGICIDNDDDDDDEMIMTLQHTDVSQLFDDLK